MSYRRLSAALPGLVIPLATAFILLAAFVTPVRAADVRPTLAVVGIHAGPTDQARAAQLTATLRDAFRQSKVFDTLPAETVEQRLATDRSALRDEAFVGPARRLRQEARVYAEEAQFSKAIDALQQAEERLLYYREHLTSNEELFDILQQRVQLRLGLGNEEEALRDLRRLAALVPGKPLDPLRFPPQILDRYSRIQLEVQSATADLEVNAESKGARVYLDGALKGQAPLTLRGVPLGRHFIRLEDPSSGVFFQDLNLTSGGLVQVFGRLGPEGIHTAPDDGIAPAVKQQMLIELYLTLGRKLKVDYLPLTSLDESGLEVQLLHIPTGRLATSFATAFRVGSSNIPQQLRTLVGRLETLIAADGTIARPAASVLAQHLDSNQQLQRSFFGTAQSAGAVQPGPATKSSRPQAARPLYKRGWFWAVVGGVALAAAGGTTYAVLSQEESTTDTLGIRFNLPTP